VEDVDAGGGVTFLTRFAVPNDGLLEEDEAFSLTGDNPCINVDHGAICFAISEAAALLAAVALFTVLASLVSEWTLELPLPLPFELNPEYPRLCAYGLNELIEDDAVGRSVLFNGLSATLRIWVPLPFVVVLAATVGVGMAPSPAAAVSLDLVAVDTAEETAEDTTEPPTEGEEALNGVALGVLPGVACRSRMLMSRARSFVAASRIEMTPVYYLLTLRNDGRKENQKKKTNLHHPHTQPLASSPSTAAPKQAASAFFAV
jgi:hypothetical protein